MIDTETSVSVDFDTKGVRTISTTTDETNIGTVTGGSMTPKTV
jgi:hypothetical protein